MSGDWLRRPASPAALAGLGLLSVVAVVFVLTVTGHHDHRVSRVTTVTTPAAPSAVIGTKPLPPILSAAQLDQARATGRRFLASYLPVLYGRARAKTIADASGRVLAELANAAQPPRAPRDHRPRVTTLTTRAQNATTVVAIAVIADSVSRPYQVVFQLTDTPGGWQVTELANY